MTMIVAAQAQTPPALPDVSMWQVFTADPTFAIFSLVPVAVIVVLVLVVRHRYARFFKIQREALDHRKTADAEVLAQNRSVEDTIARQYATVNAHNEQVLARSEETARVLGQMLTQITTVNASLIHIAERLDRITGPAG
jgi:ABC-type multidrug transport system fused ATPase/permease subunit